LGKTVALLDESIRMSIRSEGCVSIRAERKSCNLCQAACHKGCLKVMDDRIELKHDDCTACGICSAVCPCDVYGMPKSGYENLSAVIQTLSENGPEPLVFTCARNTNVGTEGDGGNRVVVVLNCLSMAGPGILLEAAGAGFTSVTLEAPCEGCEVLEGEDVIRSRFEDAKPFFGQFKDVGFHLSIDGTVNAGSRGHDRAGLASTRRGFFGAFRRFVASNVEKSIAPEVIQGTVPKGRLKPIPLPPERKNLNRYLKTEFEAKGGGHILSESDSIFRLVDVDAAACTVCHACGGFCPTGAIKRIESPQDVSLILTPEKCVKCVVCKELCPKGAIRYQETFSAASVLSGPRQLVERKLHKCVSCERPFQPVNGEERCRGCVKLDKFTKTLMKQYERRE